MLHHIRYRENFLKQRYVEPQIQLIRAGSMRQGTTVGEKIFAAEKAAFDVDIHLLVNAKDDFLQKLRSAFYEILPKQHLANASETTAEQLQFVMPPRQTERDSAQAIKMEKKPRPAVVMFENHDGSVRVFFFMRGLMRSRRGLVVIPIRRAASTRT